MCHSLPVASERRNPNQHTTMSPELSSIARSFASDLAQLPEWSGPKSLNQFSDEDWTRFADYVSTDDGTLSEEDQAICEEIATAIEDA
jgi:hypothetical protein